jgi:hypothetical protein
MFLPGARIFGSWAETVGGGRQTEACGSCYETGVLFHDPGASRPRDLDDPYFDPKVQERMADMIAGAARKR